MKTRIRPPGIILHIPHASKLVPPEERKAVILSDEELDAELLRMTDHYTDELFAPPDARFVPVCYGYSRLVVDPERFPDDEQEPMVEKGMGAIYTHSSRGARLRLKPDSAVRRRMLDTFYRPHHRQLELAVHAAVDCHGKALIVDCHSFPQRPSPYEHDQSPERPDICIGTDDFHTPVKLADVIVGLFRERGYSVEVNRPFAGTLVPLSRYRKDDRVTAVMIELNRRLYMNETTGGRSPGLAGLAKVVGEILLTFANEFESK